MRAPHASVRPSHAESSSASLWAGPSQGLGGAILPRQEIRDKHLKCGLLCDSLRNGLHQRNRIGECWNAERA
jgi:hypothetical protein